MTIGAKLSVLLADDHPLVRDGLKRVINEQEDMAVVAEAKDGPEALLLARTLSPRVALIDVSMPGWDGVKLAQALATQCPDVKVIAVTRHTDEAFVTRMLNAGASGYVLKQRISAELTHAVRAVAAGERYVDQSLRGALAPGAASSSRASIGGTHEAFTSHEEHVLRLVAGAYSTLEIARQLNMSALEVSDIKDAAMRKAGLQTRLHVIEYAQTRGWT